MTKYFINSILLILSLLIIFYSSSGRADERKNNISSRETKEDKNLSDTQILPPAKTKEAKSSQEKIITEIEIKGNRKVEEATIRFYIRTKVGRAYSSRSIREDIHRLYDLGHFEDIQVEKENLNRGIKLIYTVVEKSTIREIKISGNKKISEEDLREKLRLKKGAVFNHYLLKEDLEKIKKLYEEKGYYFARVNLETKEIGQNQLDLKLVIIEGKKIKIKKIKFAGNTFFSDRRLRKEMETTTKGLFSWLTGLGIYKKEVLKMDILKLESFYHDHGFAKIRVYDPEIEINREKKAIYITIPLTEGEQYRVKKIEIEGDNTYKVEELFSLMKLKKGAIFNKSLLREDIFKLTELYSRKGYAYPDIIPLTTLDDQENKVVIKLEIGRGKKFYLGKIKISGNTRTRDLVIRREFRLKEGEVFNSKKLRRSMQRINNLGFFEDVKLNLEPGEKEDLLDLDTTVTEKLTGQFSIMGGYSSFDEFIYSAQISENNLLGLGQKLSLTFQKSRRREDYMINFTEPRVFDREISAGFELFSLDTQYYRLYTSLSQGGGVRLGKGLGEYNWLNLGYKYEDVKIKEVVNPTEFLRNEERITSRITSSFSRDTRDDYWNPTAGIREELKSSLAGSILGGTNFYKLGAEVSYYHPLVGKFIGLLHGQIEYASGYGGDRLPIFERYLLGRWGDLRGFDPRYIGPRDKQGEPLGGDKLLLFNAEIHYPFNKAVRGIIFYDRGNVFGDGDNLNLTAKNYSLSQMRHSVGVGIRFVTPMPINFSVGFKLDRREIDGKRERLEDYNFNIGGLF